LRQKEKTMTHLTHLTIADAVDGLKAKKFSATELTKAHIAAVEKAKALNAFITETPELALKQAAASDARLAKGEAGPLEGIPLAIKDLYCTKDVLTTASSHILDGFKPKYESTVTSQLWRDGAVMLGKVALDEFAMGSSTTTNYYGNVINPWSPWDGKAFTQQLVPGGSSGGSSAAVAARCAMGATGRIPAAPSASPPVLPVFPALSLLMAAARAGALSLLRRRSIRPGQWPAQSRTARSC
jgi:aspartyl-tRNA(Asn)/glutamyl-tRNA(Gln) amidotransferase subunit A